MNFEYQLFRHRSNCKVQYVTRAKYWPHYPLVQMDGHISQQSASQAADTVEMKTCQDQALVSVHKGLSEDAV